MTCYQFLHYVTGGRVSHGRISSTALRAAPLAVCYCQRSLVGVFAVGIPSSGANKKVERRQADKNA